MLHSKGIEAPDKSTVDILLDRLLVDREFRSRFFQNAVEEVEKLNIECKPKLAACLHNLSRTSACADIAQFNDKLVLCSSSPG